MLGLPELVAFLTITIPSQSGQTGATCSSNSVQGFLDFSRSKTWFQERLGLLGLVSMDSFEKRFFLVLTTGLQLEREPSYDRKRVSSVVVLGYSDVC